MTDRMHNLFLQWSSISCFLFLIALTPPSLADSHATAESPPTAMLASAQKALLPIVVSEDCDAVVLAAAKDLQEYLQKISGAPFTIQEVAADFDGSQPGIVVGLETSFPNRPARQPFDDLGIGPDQYLLCSATNQLYVLGSTPTAVENAVWDLLHRLGYRLFFLTDTWEVVPDQPELSIAICVTEKPDYVTRQAPRGAPWSDRELWTRWKTRNRLNSSYSLSTGHAYGNIVRRHQDAFSAHPEYFALVDGERRTGPNAKFCISNPGLRQLVVDHAVATIKADPRLNSISMDPSDGGGWCECDKCAAMGSVSDRALTLANDAATAINKLGLGPKHVGMYGYNQHSPPPNIKAHPNVVISVATAFIRGGYSVEELVEGWQRQDAVIGIRDYHDVFAWSHDLPRKARGGKIEYLTHTIPWFYEHGARFMNSENMDSWGANGLGYWLTPQILWDVDNAQQVDDLIEDFLTGAFGEAAAPMREFFQLLNQDSLSVRSQEDVVARMYRFLDQAQQLTSDRQIHARIADLILYTRYLELYQTYRVSKGSARQAAFEQVWRHAYRIQDRMMLSTVALCQRDRFRDSTVNVPDEADWKIPEEENPWKSSEPFSTDEIQDILTEGIKANQPTVLDFVAQNYSDDLVPANQLNLAPVPKGRYDNRNRGTQRVHTWLPKPKSTIDLQVTGGLIKHYRDRGNVQFQLYAQAEATLDAVDTDNSVPPDGIERTVRLSSPYSGLHSIEWNDGSDQTQVVWPADIPWTVRSSIEEPMRLGGRWDLYFYVPRGTKIVGGYTDSTRGELHDSQGNLLFDFSQMDSPGYFSVAVPSGQDRALWKFVNSRGSRMLMTVPPYLAPSAESLLLPREVVDADHEE